MGDSASKQIVCELCQASFATREEFQNHWKCHSAKDRWRVILPGTRAKKCPAPTDSSQPPTIAGTSGLERECFTLPENKHETPGKPDQNKGPPPLLNQKPGASHTSVNPKGCLAPLKRSDQGNRHRRIKELRSDQGSANRDGANTEKLINCSFTSEDPGEKSNREQTAEDDPDDDFVNTKPFKTVDKKQLTVLTKFGQYPCLWCGKSFSSNFNQQRHAVKHHENKDYFPCRTCGKVFYRRDSLRRHGRMHKDDRPFSCRTCSSRFKHHHHLIEHVRKDICFRTRRRLF